MARYGITEAGFLVEGESLTIFSPSAGKFIPASIPVAAFLDSTFIPEAKAAELMKDPSSLKDPLKDLKDK